MEMRDGIMVINLENGIRMEIEFLSRQIISISQSNVLEKVGNLVILMLYSFFSYSSYGLVTGLSEQ